MAGQEINWDRLDKFKFFYVGVGLFSGVTTTLFPLSVIKTRQMASHHSAHAGLAGTRLVARTIWQQEGVRGFYRGFGTVLLGTMPGRTIYMTSLEMAKSAVQKVGDKLDIAPSALAGVSSFVGGAAGSLSTQAVVVPIDVVSQRLMVAGAELPGAAAAAAAAAGGSSAAGTAAARRANGFQMARLIIQQEGVAGLYRGFWPSVCTFVPSNAIWWGGYGFWKQHISLWCGLTQHSSGAGAAVAAAGVGTGAVVGVQVAAGILSGCSSALLTNPLDLVKTRLQVAEPVAGVVPSWGGVLRELLLEEGPRGLLRGVGPRMASSCLWGTCMVSAYEFLKSICALPDAE
ncbi:putative mitochondrial carrier protein [Scenedesmus sp. NREL 46B-D3]|nr:putative mitochondrial carrier protein [Scenedesmus sp. NREL 46B-D3]